MVEEPGIDTHLPRLRTLGLQVEVRVVRRCGPRLRLAVERIGDRRHEAVVGVTHLGVRSADLQEAQPLRSIDHVGDHGRKTHRRIEERRVVREGQLRLPVVAARQRQVEHRLPAHLDVGEDRLRLIVVARLLRFELRLVVEVVDGEEVRQRGELSIVAQLLVLRVVDRGTEVHVQRPVLAEVLVHRGDHVGIGVVRVGADVAVGAVLTGPQTVGRSIELVGEAVVVVVDLHTSRNVEPVGDLPLERRVGHVTLLGVLAQLAVLHPVGVLHTHTVVAIGPVYRAVTQGRVVTLVHADLVEVLAAREEVETRKGIVVETLRGHVAVVLLDEAAADVERQLVLDERRRVAGREVVTVIGRVGQNTRRVGRRYRSVGLVALRTRRERYRVDDVRTRVEEVARIVVRIDHVAPADHLTDGVAVLALHLGHHVNRREGRAVRYRNGRLVRLSLLGRDEHDAAGGGVTGKGGGRRSRQHRDRLDVVGVDIRNTIGTGLVRHVRAVHRVREVEHRNTVDHIECQVRTRQRLRTAHHDTRGTSGAVGTGVDLHTGHLADERVHEVGVLHGGDLLGLDLLHVVRQSLLLALNTHGRYDHRLNLRSGLLKRDVQEGLTGEDDLLRVVTHEGDHDDIALIDSGQFECSIDVGNGSDGGVLDGYGRADNGTESILYRSTNDLFLGLLCEGCRGHGYFCSHEQKQRAPACRQYG